MSFQHDALNRLLQIDYGPVKKPLGKGDFLYIYDEAERKAVGRLASVQNRTTDHETYYTYDEQGRTITVERLLQGSSYHVKTEYDHANRITKLTYPNDEFEKLSGAPRKKPFRSSLHYG